MSVSRFIADLVSRSTTLTLILALALTLLAANAVFDPFTGVWRLDIDPSTDRILPEHSAAKQFYDKTQRIFGSDESLVIMLTGKDIFTADLLNRVRRMTKGIEAIPQVHHVVSLTNALDIRSAEGDLDISPFVPGPEVANPDYGQIRARVLANPMYAGTLVSKTGDATALVVYFRDITDRQYLRQGVHKAVTSIVDAEKGPYKVYMSGAPFLKVAVIHDLIGDLMFTLPVIMAILVVVLALSFRTVTGVFVPLATVAVGVLFTLGTISALGFSLSMISILVPPLLMILGFTYSVHVVAEYSQIRTLPDSHETAVEKTLEHVTLPVVLTGLTTIAGFVSLIANPIQATREFGIFATIGVVYTTILSITLTPALIRLLDRNPAPWQQAGSGARHSRFDRFTEWVARFDLNHRLGIFVACGLILVAACLGMMKIHVSTEAITNFSRDSAVRTGFDAINAKLGGANTFYIVVQANHQGAFKEPAQLAALHNLQQWLGKQPEIGGTISIADYLMQVNQALHDNDPAYYRIPDSKRLITQLLFVSSNDELGRIVDTRYDMANIIVRSSVINSDRMAALVSRINAHLRNFPEHLKPVVTGSPVLISDTLTSIIHGQAISVGIALVLVYILMSLMFLSVRTGLITMLPNILPVAVYFGSLGFFGISLNPSTSLIAPMVLGIAIDDTIHYFSRFNTEVRRNADDRKATLLALKSVGRPMTYTSIGLCLGFLVLTTSALRMQVQVGLMASYALAIAWLSDFFMTPALCASFRFTTLWDALTLDLGEKPQESIPLLQGLRTSQARIVALMARVIEVPAGVRIITAGQASSEMFVVIDGTLKTSVQGQNGRIELGTHERGDVIGEGGFFYNTRSADVDVVTNSRLLCLTQANLDRLSRRYPFIAAKVFRNLNLILASRLFNTTRRLV
jgi:predicted RND superfamily exporter protein